MSILYLRSETLKAELIVRSWSFGYELGYASGFGCDGPRVRMLQRILSDYSVSYARLMALSVWRRDVSYGHCFRHRWYRRGVATERRHGCRIRSFSWRRGNGQVRGDFNFMQLSPFAAAYILWTWIQESHRLGNSVGIRQFMPFHPSAFGCSRDLQPTQTAPAICLRALLWRPCLPRQGGGRDLVPAQ